MERKEREGIARRKREKTRRGELREERKEKIKTRKQ